MDWVGGGGGGARRCGEGLGCAGLLGVIGGMEVVPALPNPRQHPAITLPRQPINLGADTYLELFVIDIGLGIVVFALPVKFLRHIKIVLIDRKVTGIVYG